MSVRIRFTGSARYRIRCVGEFARSVMEVLLRRRLKGPRRQGWNFFVEACTAVLKKQVATAFCLGGVDNARAYLDCMEISSPALAEIAITSVEYESIRGAWFRQHDSHPDVTLLYLHGGGYSFYPRSYRAFIASITLAARSETFALDYPLAPEHRFPAQLDDAVQAYRWLINNGTDPGKLIIAGDSAGGHLALGLLLTASDLKLPLPAVTIALSPAIGFEIESFGDNHFDWINKTQVRQWSNWFCDPARRSDARVSLLKADWQGLSPIYIQAGRAEILFDSIQVFADRAKAQGADVVFEAWDDMNHVFQIFGRDAPQSAAALRRIGEVIDDRVRHKPNASHSHAKESTPWNAPA